MCVRPNGQQGLFGRFRVSGGMQGAAPPMTRFQLSDVDHIPRIGRSLGQTRNQVCLVLTPNFGWFGRLRGAVQQYPAGEGPDLAAGP